MCHMKRIGKINRQYDYYDPRGSPHREVLRSLERRLEF